MTDKEFTPLTTVCIRALNDKLYEKRKTGALEVERIVRELIQNQQDQQVKTVLKILGESFVHSTNPNSRKGGLIGLAAVAIALGKESGTYVNELVKPVLTCFYDADSQVRYYSCEALYNIVKVTRGSVLPFFNEIFDRLSKLSSDTDQNVKSGIELLDRLLKDIVTESASFDLVSFIPLLRKRIYNKNPYARQFIVSWIITLDAVPDINMLVLLPEFLDGLLEILGDSNQEIRKMCLNTLKEFLAGIRETQSYVNFPQMVNILIVHSENHDDDLISYTAILWLKEFVILAGRSMLPFLSGILHATLPRLGTSEIDTETRKNVREVAECLNKLLMDLVKDLDDNPMPTGTYSQGNFAEDYTVNARVDVTMETKPNVGDVDPPDRLLHLDVLSVIAVLCELVKCKEFQTRIASLKWFRHLLLKVPNKTFCHMSLVFPVLMKTLADIDQSDEGILLALDTLARITSYPIKVSAMDIKKIQIWDVDKDSSSPTFILDKDRGSSTSLVDKDRSSPTTILDKNRSSPTLKNDSPGSDSKISIDDSGGIQESNTNAYFMEFMVQLVDIFKKNQNILEKRGAFIIRQLCLVLSSEDIFRSLSEILIKEEDFEFSCTMVHALNTILLTSTELFELRNQLKDLHSKESCQLFCCLYRSWSHSPVATLALCYLSQNYTHACRLLPIFGNLEVTIELLNEIDKLIQLIESPIFAYLRLKLLDVDNSEDLIKSLYGLLMLLPQAEPFKLLRNRLNCLPHFQMAAFSERKSEKKVTQRNDLGCDIDFEELLLHFVSMQEKHKEARRKQRLVLDK